MNSTSDGPSYGGEKLRVRCPHCDYRLTLIDRQFMEYGPIRCGACGAEIKQTLITRVLEEAPTPGPPRGGR